MSAQNMFSKVDQRQVAVYLIACDVRSYVRYSINQPRGEISLFQLKSKMKDLSAVIKKCLERQQEWTSGKVRFSELLRHHRQLQFLMGRIFKGEVDAATFPTVRQRLDHLDGELENLLRAICDMFKR